MQAPAPEITALLQEGLAHHQAMRLTDARRCYQDLLAVAPDHADGLHLLGLVAHASGDHAGALTSLRHAVRLRPDAAHFRANLGTACLAAGDLAGAEASLRAALERDPRDGDAWHNLGLAWLNGGRAEEAERAFRAAIAVAPHLADAHANLGACLHRLGRLAEAAAALHAALARDPALEPALGCLGLVMAGLGNPAAAEQAYRRALSLRPDHAATHTNLGAVLRGMGQLDAAESAFRRAVALRPEEADGWHNLGALLACQGRLAAAEAEACCRRALRLDPAHADAHYTLGTVLLLGGRLPEGFEGLEWRWRRRGFSTPRNFEQPRWRGEALAGRTLLLHAEQGLGDTIQMLRFVPAIAAAAAVGGCVVLEVPATLRRLATGMAGSARVVMRGADLPAFDVQCPLPSLPAVLGISLAGIPSGVPYLRADATDIAAWSRRVGALAGLRVGFAWAGNPLYAADATRSIPPARLAALASVPDVAFVSLQPGAARPEGLELHDWTAELRDLADTAALIECLDVVVSVDTAVAHLAGALGRPVWLLNRFDTDWRWLLDRTDSPWYPTLRQIRQHRPGDWDGVLAALRAVLAGHQRASLTPM